MGHFGDALMEQGVVMGHGGQGIAQYPSGAGELELLVTVGEQLGPVLALKITDVLRHGGLGEGQLLGRPRVVQGLAHSEEGFDAEVLHGDPFGRCHGRMSVGTRGGCERSLVRGGGCERGADPQRDARLMEHRHPDYNHKFNLWKHKYI